MKVNAILFIFTSIVYNLIDLSNESLHFINAKFLDDFWYCVMYGHLVFFFWIFRKQHDYINIAFWAAVARLFYNFMILLNIIKHTPHRSAYFVLCVLIILLILDYRKKIIKEWHLLRSHR